MAFLQTTFAAVSFAGAGYLFKLFDSNGYEEEMKRHHLAVEESTRIIQWERNKKKWLDPRIKTKIVRCE